MRLGPNGACPLEQSLRLIDEHDHADTTTAKFHASLNVSDLTRSVEFYRSLFGLDSSKRCRDYAKLNGTNRRSCCPDSRSSRRGRRPVASAKGSSPRAYKRLA
jgi:hypothetical protein